jgi:hypothetical protein
MKKLQFLFMAVAALVVFAACDDDTRSGGKSSPAGGGIYGDYPELIVGSWRCDNNDIVFDAPQEIEEFLIQTLDIDPSNMSFVDNGDVFEFREDGTSWDGETEVEYTVSGRTLTIIYSEETAGEFAGMPIKFDIQTLNATTFVGYCDMKAILTEMMQQVPPEVQSMFSGYLNQIKTFGIKMTCTRVD